jgi:uncharacterized protein YcbK (DUF882 family)
MVLKYFTLNEFDCPSEEGSGSKMDKDFLEKLDLARDLAGVSFKINSGFRTKEHNDSLPNSKPDSAHIEGKAVDIHCTNSRERFIITKALLDAQICRIGIGKTFIHCDTSETKDPDVIWLYS